MNWLESIPWGAVVAAAIPALAGALGYLWRQQGQNLKQATETVDALAEHYEKRLTAQDTEIAELKAAREIDRKEFDEMRSRHRQALDEEHQLRLGLQARVRELEDQVEDLKDQLEASQAHTAALETRLQMIDEQKKDDPGSN